MTNIKPLTVADLTRSAVWHGVVPDTPIIPFSSDNISNAHLWIYKHIFKNIKHSGDEKNRHTIPKPNITAVVRIVKRMRTRVLANVLETDIHDMDIAVIQMFIRAKRKSLLAKSIKSRMIKESKNSQRNITRGALVQFNQERNSQRMLRENKSKN